MREILFRGKDPNAENKWYYGDYVRLQCPFTEDGEPVKHMICSRTDAFTYAVDPATVGQYTGLKDIHGKRIFEGDILKCYDPMFITSFVGEVLYKDGSFCIREKDDEELFHFRWVDYEAVVIGSIYDNPELMEG